MTKESAAQSRGSAGTPIGGSASRQPCQALVSLIGQVIGLSLLVPQGLAKDPVVELPLAPSTTAPTIVPPMPSPRPTRASLATFTCPSLILETVPSLVAALSQMMVDKSGTFLVVPTLVELFLHEEEPQKEPPHNVPLPTSFLPSDLLVSLPEESSLGLLVDTAAFLGFFSLSATPSSATAHCYLFLPPLLLSRLLGLQWWA